MARKSCLLLSLCCLTAFIGWTATVLIFDIQAIGPDGSTVGLAELNRFVHHLTGVHMALYVATDRLSIIPLFFVAVFGLLGLRQWIQRKALDKVDRSILVLGGFYAATLAAFLFFEKFIVNYRPVLIDGILEASYPSSTTMLVVCVMSTAAIQWKKRIQNSSLKKWGVFLIHGFTVFMVIGRLLSGVHWFTDIVGGILLSTGLVLLYAGLQ